MTFFTKLLGSVFGIGFSPWFPGTLGSLFACLLFIFSPMFHQQIILIGFTFFLFLTGIWIGNHAEKSGKKDPCWFVLDEWVGQNIPFFILTGTDFELIAVSFILFRIFDISKILKINSVQKYHGGIGIMLDDVLAGFYTLIIVGGIKWFMN